MQVSYGVSVLASTRGMTFNAELAGIIQVSHMSCPPLTISLQHNLLLPSIWLRFITWLFEASEV